MSTSLNQTRIQTSNILARSIVQDLVHQCLHQQKIPTKKLILNPFFRQSSISSSSSSISEVFPRHLSNSSTTSVFVPDYEPNPDPDLPSHDKTFSIGGRSIYSSKSRRTPISRSKSMNPPKNLKTSKNPSNYSLFIDENEFLKPIDDSRTKPITSEIIEQKQIQIDSRRNAVVNQLRKIVKFPEQIKWPQSRFFTHDIGKEKIIEMIEKTWNYDPRLIYIVDFYSVTGYSTYQRFRYFVRWHSPNGNFAHVYFNIDVTRNQSEKPVNVTYTFEDGKIVHK